MSQCVCVCMCQLLWAPKIGAVCVCVCGLHILRGSVARMGPLERERERGERRERREREIVISGWVCCTGGRKVGPNQSLRAEKCSLRSYLGPYPIDSRDH